MMTASQLGSSHSRTRTAPVSEAISITRRARTDEQKRLRRRRILDAAATQFSEVGFEAFSMAELGKQAGVAKGTLYLYFATREEVLLTLFCEKLAAWQLLMDQAVAAGCSDAELAGIFYRTICADPALLPLMSRLDSVIEHNVSLDALISAKRVMATLLRELCQAIAPRLNLSFEQTLDAVRSLGALLLGAAQVDAGPRLDDEQLPRDVQQLMSAFDSKSTFTTNAQRILAGIRAGG